MSRKRQTPLHFKGNATHPPCEKRRDSPLVRMLLFYGGMPRLHSNARLASALVATVLAIGQGCSAPGASSPIDANDVAPRPSPGATSKSDGGALPNANPPVNGSILDGGAVVLPDGAVVLPDAGLPNADAAQPPPVDPCPNLPIPTAAFNREVLYREWSLSATGDGTYFASQAPYRLGFTRVQNRMWIMKFRTEANSYRGRISAGADSSSGLSWISSAPTDADWAVKNKLVAWGSHGSAMLDFLVIKDDADATKLATDPALAAWRGTPTLRGDHCYYFGFENVSTFPTGALDTSFFTSPDDCGATGNGTCWYLGIDVGHFLHEPSTGATVAGNVIPGLTH